MKFRVLPTVYCLIKMYGLLCPWCMSGKNYRPTANSLVHGQLNTVIGQCRHKWEEI